MKLFRSHLRSGIRAQRDFGDVRMVVVSLSAEHRVWCGRWARSAKLVGSGIGLIALAACGQQNAYVPPPPPKVVIAQPLQEKVPLYAELTGNLRSVAEVKLEARVQGFLEQIKYVDGATVKKGDLLFVIQQNTYQAQRAQAKAALQSNQATQRDAQVEFTRQPTLAQQLFASQPRLDDARSKPAEANANVLT